MHDLDKETSGNNTRSTLLDIYTLMESFQEIKKFLRHDALDKWDQIRQILRTFFIGSRPGPDTEAIEVPSVVNELKDFSTLCNTLPSVINQRDILKTYEKEHLQNAFHILRTTRPLLEAEDLTSPTFEKAKNYLALVREELLLCRDRDREKLKPVCDQLKRILQTYNKDLSRIDSAVIKVINPYLFGMEKTLDAILISL
jgi:hypothetical protein